MDFYQICSINEQRKFNYKKQKIFQDNLFLSFCVGVIVGVSSLFVVDLFKAAIEKKDPYRSDAFLSSMQAYYAGAIAGGINGLLVLILPPTLYSMAAVIVLTIVYETIAGLTGLETQTSKQLIRSIVRDIFLVLFIVDFIEKLTGDNIDDEPANLEEKNGFTPFKFDELLTVTFVSSVVLNISLYGTSNMVNNLLGIKTDAQTAIPSDVLA